jgi:hypothetical protein
MAKLPPEPVCTHAKIEMSNTLSRFKLRVHFVKTACFPEGITSGNTPFETIIGIKLLPSHILIAFREIKPSPFLKSVALPSSKRDRRNGHKRGLHLAG